MNLKEALALVLELAEDSILDPMEVVSEEVLQNENKRQRLAAEIVRDHLDAMKD